MNWVLRSSIALCPWLQPTRESFWPKQGVSGVRSEARYQRVVGGGPAFCRHIEAAIDRIAEIDEAADAGVQVEDRIGVDREVVPESHALAVGLFRAAVFAKAGAERILRQAEQLPIGEAAEKGLPAVDRLVDAGHIFVRIAARAGVLKKVKDGSLRSWDSAISLFSR